MGSSQKFSNEEPQSLPERKEIEWKIEINSLAVDTVINRSEMLSMFKNLSFLGSKQFFLEHKHSNLPTGADMSLHLLLI